MSSNLDPELSPAHLRRTDLTRRTAVRRRHTASPCTTPPDSPRPHSTPARPGTRHGHSPPCLSSTAFVKHLVPLCSRCGLCGVLTNSCTTRTEGGEINKTQGSTHQIWYCIYADFLALASAT